MHSKTVDNFICSSGRKYVKRLQTFLMLNEFVYHKSLSSLIARKCPHTDHFHIICLYIDFSL